MEYTLHQSMMLIQWLWNESEEVTLEIYNITNNTNATLKTGEPKRTVKYLTTQSGRSKTKSSTPIAQTARDMESAVIPPSFASGPVLRWSAR